MERKHSLEQVLEASTKVRAATGYNDNECVGKRQQGGVCTIGCGDTVTKIIESGRDLSGLGRWSWIKVRGCRGQVTRMITAYQPVRARKKGHNTVYRQHIRYFDTIGRRGCPRKLFREDLRNFLLQCVAEGERLIIMLDANENMHTGKLARLFRAPDLDLVDTVFARTGQAGPPTWFRGSSQIDGIWASRGITIQRAAFLPFFFGIGDHRPILVDFSSEAILQEQSIQVKIPEMRRLQCDNPVILDRYISRLEALCLQHKIPTKQRALHSSQSSLSDVEWIRQTESLDSIKRDLMRAAEKKCRRLRTGGLPYSPELEVARRRVWVWKKVIYRKEGGRIQKSYVRRRGRSCGIDRPFHRTLEEAQVKLTQAQEELNRITPQAPELRSKYLDRIDDEEDEEKERVARQAKKKREQLRHSWRAIRKAFGKGHMGSVKVVEVRRNGEWTRVTDRYDIETSIIQENSKRFRLTEGTPLMTAFAKEMFGQLADSEMAEQVLRGEFDYELVDPDLAQFFRLFAQAQVHPISASISQQDFQQYWGKARERTASSISGLHFGHYKAAAASNLLSSIHASSIESAFSRGYPLQRWTRGLSCMLEKEEGVIKVDKLRAILLLEADFNFATKLLVGKRMVDNLEGGEDLAEEQFGSRKQRSAIEVALNRRLLSDLSRQKRATMAIAGVDAAHCYDRVAHPFAILACRAIGVPKAVVQTIFSAVQQMKMKVRTAYGESEAWYGGDPETPFQGLCQGNGCGPAVWLVVSMFVVRFLRLKGRVSTIWSALSCWAFEVLGLMFVDDSDLVHFAADHESPTQVADNLDATVQCWQSGLNISGGTLRPPKCYWYLLHYKWRGGVAQFADGECRDISVRDANGVEGMVERLPASEAKEVVGVWIAPDGNNVAQMNCLQAKIVRMTVKLQECTIPILWVWRGYLMGMWKSIAYPLGACTLTPEDCNDLAKSIYRTVLPAMGVNRNIPKVMRYAPARFGGLGLPSPELEQGAQQLRLLLQHGPSSTLSGNLIRASLEQLQLEIGELEPVLSLPYHRFHHLATDTWITQVWRFCSENSIRLEWDNAVIPPRSREWDRGIMDMCRASGITSPLQQLSINRVRCYLQVITMADIVSANGRRIRQDVLDGAHWARRSTYRWGKEQPTDLDWIEWKRALRIISNHNGALAHPLGRWIAAPHLQHEWIWSADDGFLYQYLGVGHQWWQRYSSTSISGTTFEAGRWTRRIPQTFQVAQVLRIDETTVRLQSGTEVRSKVSALDSVQARRQATLEEWIQQHVQWHVERATARDYLRSGRCRIVTDGSYMKERAATLGAAFWIMETMDGIRICSGGCLTSGGIANPFRAELTGLYGVLATLTCCMGRGEISTRMEVGCDCKGAVRSLSWQRRTITCSTKHHDIRREIDRLRKLLGPNLLFKHISGHRDDIVAWRDLTRWEQLNVMCDTGAKRLLVNSIAEGRPPQESLPTELWKCWAGGRRITGDLHKPILVAATAKEMREKLDKYGALPKLGFAVVDWELVDRARASLSQKMHIWLMKHISGFCGSGVMMNRMGLWDDTRCRCCLQAQEMSPWHILECRHGDLLQARKQMISSLRQWMEDQLVDDWMASALLLFLQDGGWPMDWDGTLNPLQFRLLHSLERIGARGILLGFLPKGMVEWQRNSFLLMGVKRSPELLLSRLSSKLLRELHALWLLRCDIVHERDANGLYVEDGRELSQRISEEFEKGRTGLEEESFYLLDEPLETMLLKPLAVKISWLRDVLFARGEMEAARALGSWLRSTASRKRRRKTADDLRAGKRRRDTQLAQQRQRCTNSTSNAQR